VHSPTLRYHQDALNRRVAKEVNGTIVEKYLWEDLTTLLAIYDKDDRLVWRFEYADQRMPVPMTDANGAKYHLHYDQVGSLRAVSDTNGNILNDSNPSFHVPFGFAGGLYDPRTRLTHFGYREYDSFTGKWTAKDPIGFAGGDSNLYGYVLGDPVNLVDPFGLWIPQAIGAVVGAGFEWYYNGWGWNVAVGAATGAFGGFGSTIPRAAAFGAAGSAANNAYHQIADNQCEEIDLGEITVSAGLGAAGGVAGRAIGNAGQRIKDYSQATPTITNVKYPNIRWDGPIGDYGRVGAAVGAAVGGAVSNSGGSW